MKNIQAFDRAKKTGEGFKELNVNRTFYWAYHHSLAAGTELLNFDDVIWDGDVEEILENSERFGIKEFTISTNMSGVISTIASFVDKGCELGGLVVIPSGQTDWETKENKMIPAVLIRRK